MEVISSTLITGVVATALSDVYAIARKVLFGIPPPNYGLVGRWFAYMPSGQFRHEAIAKSAPLPNENTIGWTAHYLIGIAYAAVLVAIRGEAWLKAPTLVPALLVGMATVAAPFLVMQPGMGAGVAASRTPRPNAARIQSVIMHAVFGIGLYVGAWTAGMLDSF